MRYFASAKVEKRIREITNKIKKYPFSKNYKNDRITLKKLNTELDKLLKKRKRIN